jgi:hypothetical protein
MHEQTKSITWDGESFSFQRLTLSQPGSDPSLWAVFRQGEFIGTMFCPPDVTTGEFELRAIHWAQELLGGSRFDARAGEAWPHRRPGMRGRAIAG